MTTPLGTQTNLAGGTLACSLPAGTKFWYVQNQDTAPIVLTSTVISSSPTAQNIFGMTTVILTAASAKGEGNGGWIDSIGFPFIDGFSFTLTSTLATAQFGSGATAEVPVNSFARSV